MSPRILIASLLAATLLAACERPPMQSHQQGYRGTGMLQTDNPRILASQKAALPALPDLPPPTGATEGPKAKDVYQNVKVLGDLPIAEFTRHMLAITQWVAPEQGCTYCHGANLADDSKYTKVVARRMIEMTRHLNADWSKHVGQTGVTCYTCHRGNAVPANVSYLPPLNKRGQPGSMIGDDAGQNKAVPSIATTSLPYDPFSPCLAGGDAGQEQIRVQGTTALPTGNRQSIKQAEYTYSLMTHMSKSLGVNCTFCHNTQSFLTWTTTRATAWYGIRMARDLNHEYMEPLTKTFPANRLGPRGDVAHVNCSTCHQGVNKPLGGLAMAKDYAGLALPAAAPASAPTAAADPAAAPPAPAPEPAKGTVVSQATGSTGVVLK